MDTHYQQLSLGLNPLYRNTRRPVAIDLFAGAGGFSLGMEQAGFDVLVAVEYDPIHACTYAYNFPQTEVICASVTDISADDLNRAMMLGWQKHRQLELTIDLPNSNWNTKIDLVFGGPPCQGFSVMGKRNFDDERNSLIFHFLRLVCALRPRFFVMENVPGIAAGKYKSLLRELEAKFIQGGYWTRALCLNAADFGVPQRRRRLFLIGGAHGDDPQLLLRYLQPISPRTTVRDAIADLPDIDQFSELCTGDEFLLDDRYLELINLKANGYVQYLRGYQPVANLDLSPNQPNSFNIPDLSYPRQWNPRLLTSSMQTQHREMTKQRFAQILPGELEPISRLRRLDWDGVSHTLRAGTDSSRGRHTSPRPIHPTFARVISVREAARIHSFPDWFRFHHTKWHGFRQVGNSVPPLLARGIGDAIAKTMNRTLSVPNIINMAGKLSPETSENQAEQPLFRACLELGNPDILKFHPAEARLFWGIANQEESTRNSEYQARSV